MGKVRNYDGGGGAGSWSKNIIIKKKTRAWPGGLVKLVTVKTET